MQKGTLNRHMPRFGGAFLFLRKPVDIRRICDKMGVSRVDVGDDMDVYKGYTIERHGYTWYAVDKKNQIMAWSLSRTPEQVRAKIESREKK